MYGQRHCKFPGTTHAVQTIPAIGVPISLKTVLRVPKVRFPCLYSRFTSDSMCTIQETPTIPDVLMSQASSGEKLTPNVPHGMADPLSTKTGQTSESIWSAHFRHSAHRKSFAYQVVGVGSGEHIAASGKTSVHGMGLTIYIYAFT